MWRLMSVWLMFQKVPKAVRLPSIKFALINRGGAAVRSIFFRISWRLLMLVINQTNIFIMELNARCFVMWVPASSPVHPGTFSSRYGCDVLGLSWSSSSRYATRFSTKTKLPFIPSQVLHLAFLLFFECGGWGARPKVYVMVASLLLLARVKASHMKLKHPFSPSFNQIIAFCVSNTLLMR